MYLYGKDTDEIARKYPKAWFMIEMGMLYTILFFLVVCYAIFSPKEDVTKVTVEGIVIPSVRVPMIQSEYDGVIRKMYVRKTSFVREGSLLYELETGGRIRKIKAPMSGTIWDIAAKDGMAVAEGDALVEIVPKTAKGLVVIKVPWEDRQLFRTNTEVAVVVGNEKDIRVKGRVTSMTGDKESGNGSTGHKGYEVIVALDDDELVNGDISFGTTVEVEKEVREKNVGYFLVEPFLFFLFREKV